ncbi:MAG: DNA methyltransferase, partial [Desulfomonilaceae bacterium]
MGNENSEKEISKWPLDRKAKISKDILDTSASITPGVELSWRGKERHVKREIGHITMVERIHIVPNLCVGTSLGPTSIQSVWSNKLIRGDNRVTMNALLSGRFSREIEAVGGIKLIYIDPPFLGGADYKISLSIGETSADRNKVVQDLAYKDSWEAGPSEYLNMLYGRLLLIKDLLADDGSIWVHCDWKANFMLRAILDEVFGSTAFRNEIIWYYTNKIPDTRKRQYTNATDTIFYYCKSAKSIFNWQFEKREKPIKVSQMKKVEGKKIYPKGPDGKCVYVIRDERTADNVWKIPLLHAHPEMWGYPTQKPMRLLERIILTATNKGDLVADFFCGSGTLLEVAQKLGRKWIGCDSGKI